MSLRIWKSVLMIVFSVLFIAVVQVHAQAPSITSLSTTTGAVGASVIVTGTNFGSPQGSSTIKFNGTTATAASWTATGIVTTVPTGATTGNVVVTVSGVPSNGSSFTVVPAPSITSLSVTSGPVGLAVTVTGTNFGSSQGSGSVTFNGTSASVASWNATSIGVTVPSGATTGNVVVNASGVNSNGSSFTVLPKLSITGISPTSGPVSILVEITGTNFGQTQGSGTVSLNGTTIGVQGWADTAIIVQIPSGASSGTFSVTTDSQTAVSPTFTVTKLPVSWSDEELNPAGASGTASYTNGTFTLSTSGEWIYGTSDGMHFAYQSLSGDGSIVARVASGSGPLVQAGVMIRQTLDASSANAYMAYDQSYGDFFSRTTSGGSTSEQGGYSVAFPYWVKLVRSGSTFTGYGSTDGVNWGQIGTQTITMVQNVYIGMAISADSTSSLARATFDNVSVSSTAAPGPVITAVSATTGPVGSQVVISGSGFGATVGASLVMLGSVAVPIGAWSNTSISITIPSGATSGPLLVSVAPSMNDTNYIFFTVTSLPLPTGWLDEDVNPAGAAGSATYSSGTFTLSTSGEWIYGNSDGMHFVYQPLSGDGSIVAKIVSGSGPLAQAGVMIRQTLDASSANAYMAYDQTNTYLFSRATSGGSTAQQGGASATLPSWVKLVRSGSTLTGYASPDGVTWTQAASPTISMVQNVYIGMAISADSTSSLASATFSNVVVTTGTMPYVQSISPNSGGVATSVTISGSSFGSTQGTSTLTFNGTPPASITSWTNTQIVATVPNTVRTGPVVVTVNSNASNSDVIFVAINPVISSLSPPAGEIGSQVVISGYNFGVVQGSSYVKFNGVTATSIPSWSDTSITVNVANNFTSGPVTVTVEGVTSNSLQFNVIENISITSISPNAGPVGTSVTINGTGFGATQSNSIATFYGATASISSWSDRQIVAVVPTGASSGPVAVEVGDITAQGPVFTINSSVQLTDSLGHQSTYTTAMAGGKWYVSNAQGSGCSTCTVRGSIQTTYDNNGNVLTKTDELGRVTTYTYDANNNVTSMVQPAVNGASPTTRYTYNNLGEVLTMIDPLGQVTTNTYDSHGNLLTVATPAPNGNTAASATQFAYNSLGELTQITDALGRVTTLTYTTVGLIATITDPQHNVTTYQYDSHGNRTSITDAMNNQTTFTYDSGDRLTKITYPGGTITSTFTYDYRGRRITATDQNGKTTTYAYDDEDRLTSVKDAASNITQYAYDTENNLLSITDANSHTTNFTYDAFGRVTETTFPSNLFETYAYDAANNLTSKTDRKNQTIQYVYDALNRLTQKSYPNSTSVNYIYDLASKVQQVSDPTGTYGFSYDNMGRLTGTTTQYAFVTGTYTNSYSYDANSNRTGFTAPDGSTNTYTYDTLNRLSTLANSWAGSFGFTYDALSRRTQMTRPNNVATNYTYDNLSHLLSVLHQLSGSTIDGATYTVDSAGNRTVKTDNRANVTSNYGYDAIYELLQTTQGGTTTESYTYDPVGNRLSSLGVSPYSNNSSNELTSTPSASYTYDNNGNTLTKTASGSTTNYTWDYENRLTSVVLPGTGGTVTFKYDPLGHRIQKAFTQGSTTTTTNYVYDGNNSVQDVDQNGNLLARYTTTQNIDEPLAESRSGTINYYEADGLGSVTSLSSSTGALANSYTYDSFGKLIASSGTVTNRFQSAAREFDSETSLYFYRARYYDPSVGRFISEDPMQFKAGINFYRYIKNNVTNLEDPYGLKVQMCCVTTQVNWWVDFFSKLTGIGHCFIKTDTMTAGMGPANGGPLPACPLFIQTKIRDQSDRAVSPGDCKDVPGADEECVNKALKIGTPTGRWTPTNQCFSVANDVLDKCNTCKEDGPDPFLFDPHSFLM
jgi:RHS repeat-associated protein